MLLSMSIGVFNESLVRQVANFGINSLVILSIRQSIYTLLTVLTFVIIGIKKKGHLWYTTKYFYMHLLRGILFMVGANCWTLAITSNNSSVPLYLIYYVALVIPTLNILFSELLLGEKVNFYVKLLCFSSTCPIVYYLLTGNQVFQISLLVVACALYSLVDCITKYISTDDPLPNARIGLFIKHKGKEADMSNNFYNAITLNVLYLSTLFALGKTSYLIEGLSRSFTTPLLGGYLALMGIGSFLTFLLPLQAMKRTSLSSLQPLKILEPVMAGVFFDHKSIPIEILVALLLFLSGSAFGFINELNGTKRED